MELKTTHSENYSAPKVVRVPANCNPETVREFPFIGRSKYAQDFPNWGPITQDQFNRTSAPYRGGEVRF